MHEVLSVLELRGLLARPGTASHRSMRLTFLTEAGVELLHRCDAAVDAMEEAIVGGMSDDDAAELVRVLMGAARRL